MNQIVKAETAPTMSQATASASVLIALIVVLAGLGVFAALQVASVASVVFAVVIALTALIVSLVLVLTMTRLGRRLRYLLWVAAFVFIAFICVTRLYLGVHWVTGASRR